MSGRCQCLLPFCARTTGKWPVGSRWICGQHWRLVPAVLKRRRRRADRLADRAEIRFRQDYARRGGATEGQIRRCLAAQALAQALWRRCEDAAIQRAAGISA